MTLDTALAGPAQAAAEIPFDVAIARIRALALVLPGALPIAVNGVRVAASIRPRKVVIAGGDDSSVVMPRTAFQVVYPDGTVMIDSGLDQETHDSFGGEEPFYADAFAKLRRALDAARLILLTHFHADHVAGVLRAPNFAELARKTMISTDTAHHLLNTPHRPHLAISEQAVSSFIIHDYRRYCPVAPGMVLIKAPGHSPDSQMAYVRLQSGREVLHSVDSAWIMDNILQVKGKAAPWVREDVPAVVGHLRWLKLLHETEPNLTILVTHDDARFNAVTQSGAIGAELQI